MHPLLIDDREPIYSAPPDTALKASDKVAHAPLDLVTRRTTAACRRYGSATF
jgi:hypothetical protein